MAVRKLPAASPAYLLHRYDWSETSLILDVFTRDQGRVTVAAKGAKRPYSQLRTVLLPFQRMHLSISRPAKEVQADIFNLRSAEWAGGGPILGGSALFAGFYLNELLMRLLARHDPHPGLFDAYAASLPALASGHDPLVQAALRAFELLLLREIGHLPLLNVETRLQQAVEPPLAYVLRPEIGLMALAPQAASSVPGHLAGATWLALQAALNSQHLPSLQSLCAEHLPALRHGLRQLLHYHLGSGQLRTRDVMLDARQWMNQSPPASLPEPEAEPAPSTQPTS